MTNQNTHQFEANHGLYDSDLRYCVKCGRLEGAQDSEICPGHSTANMTNQPEQNQTEGLWYAIPHPQWGGACVAIATAPDAPWESFKHVGYVPSPYAERIIADHNACTGIANPAAIPKMVEFVRALSGSKKPCEYSGEAAAILADLRGEK